MARLVEVKPRPEYRLWVRYDDGVEGEVDVSDYTGKGLFKAWEDVGFFENVLIGSGGELIWGDKIDLCPDAVYLRLTGKAPEDLFSNLGKAEVDT